MTAYADFRRPAPACSDEMRERLLRAGLFSRLTVTLGWGLLVYASVPWQTDVFFSGQVKGTGKYKFLLFLVGAGLCVVGVISTSVRRRTPVFMKAASSYVLVALLSSFFSSTQRSASLLLATRLCVYLVAAYCLWEVVGPRLTLKVHLVWVGVLAVVAALQGWAAPNPLWLGRLGGDYPPVHPNDLGFAATLMAVYVVVKLFSRSVSVLAGVAFLMLLLTILVATSSRTSMVGLLFAAIVIACVLRGPGAIIRSTFLLVVAVAIAWLAVSGLSALPGSLHHVGDQRGGLNNRTTAWSQVLHSDRPITGWIIGNGLPDKQVDLTRAAYNFGKLQRVQPVDGAWPAALLQTGVLGVLAVATMLIVILQAAIHIPEPRWRALCLGILIILLVRSVTESIFNDVSLGFISTLVAGFAVSGPQPALRGRGVLRQPIAGSRS